MTTLEEVLGVLAPLFSGHQSYCSAPFEDCCCQKLAADMHLDSLAAVAAKLAVEEYFGLRLSRQDLDTPRKLALEVDRAAFRR